MDTRDQIDFYRIWGGGVGNNRSVEGGGLLSMVRDARKAHAMLGSETRVLTCEGNGACNSFIPSFSDTFAVTITLLQALHTGMDGWMGWGPVHAV